MHEPISLTRTTSTKSWLKSVKLKSKKKSFLKNVEQIYKQMKQNYRNKKENRCTTHKNGAKNGVSVECGIGVYLF